MSGHRMLLGVHPSIMGRLTEEWSQPYRMRLGEKFQDGTRDIEFQAGPDMETVAMREALTALAKAANTTARAIRDGGVPYELSALEAALALPVVHDALTRLDGTGER